MKKSNVFTWLIVVVTLTLLLVACGASSPSDEGSTGEEPSGEEPAAEEEEAPAADSASETLSADILLDPALATDGDSQRVNDAIYDTLVTGDGSEPALATSWTVSDDRLDYIFRLRADATFHDGSLVTADAVIANFNRWFDPDDPLHGSGDYGAWEAAFDGFKGEVNDDDTPRSVFDGAEKVDNLTVLVHLSRRDTDFLANLTDTAFSIVNPASLEAAGDSYGTSGDDVSGSGGYVVSDWGDGSLTLEPYADYWGEVPGNALEFPLG